MPVYREQPAAEVFIFSYALQDRNAHGDFLKAEFHEHFKLRVPFIAPQVFEKIDAAEKFIGAVLIFGEFLHKFRVYDFRPRIVIFIVGIADAALKPFAVRL